MTRVSQTDISGHIGWGASKMTATETEGSCLEKNNFKYRFSVASTPGQCRRP